MPSRVRTITIDCHDPVALARFWSEVTGRPMDHEGDDAWVDITDDPDSIVPDLLFQRVPEGKMVKNRVHLDLEPSIPRDEEVERILGLGATMDADRRNPDGTGWAVLLDPEGNEFCVLRSAAERKATEP
jgi:hypothetical protein